MSTVAQAAVGKWPSILTALGINPIHLKNVHGPCPICSGKDRYRFDDKNGRGSYFCSQCGPGDGFNLLQKINDWSFAETAKQVESVIGKCEATPQAKTDYGNNEKRLKHIHSGLTRITHTDAAGRYLLSRGISSLPAHDVYFHRGVDYYFKNDDNKPVKVGNFPAMVSIFRDLAGNVCTFHITYLTAGGKKIRGYPAKKVLPKIRVLNGAAIRMFVPGDTLAVGEGIETMLAYSDDSGIPSWAAGNSGLFEKIRIPESVKNVVIVCDEDRSFTGQAAGYSLAKRVVREGRMVNVVRLLGGGVGTYIDCGLDVDYCDFINQNTEKPHKNP